MSDTPKSSNENPDSAQETASAEDAQDRPAGDEDVDAASEEEAGDEPEAAAAKGKDEAKGEAKDAEAPDKQGGMGMAIGVLGFVVALGGGFFIGQWWNNRSAASNVEVAEGPRYKIELRGDEPQIGRDDALVTIVEFADYQCPYCVKAAGPVKQAAEKDDDVRLIYVHYPLPSHPKAGPAAQAAWAAHQQGKFWEMHAWLFEQKGDLNGLEQKAKALGLDFSKLKSDMLSDAASEAVDAGFLAGGKAGVTGTPTFFVNGRRYVGSKSLPDWKKIIAAEKKDAERMVAAGTPRAQLYAKIMAEAVENRAAPKKEMQPRERRPGEPDPEATYRIPTQDRPSLGPDDALVTIVQFSDFECGYCERVAPTVKDLVERHDDVRVVFRNLPLPMHAAAIDAAKAALAAGRQGKFWEMHDALFANRKRLRVAPWSELAGDLGLDVERFESDMQDGAIEAMLEEDIALARSFNLRSTPVAFVNGRFIAGALPPKTFDTLIEEERERALALVASGTSRAGVYDALMQTAQTEVTDP
jgi:protein-disulfide isomerase